MGPNKQKTVDRLKTEHECDEHWKLRRLFLLANKKKFPKNRLLCLAQVFINVEIMGCRYPQETMDLVASMSAGLPEVQSFRERRRAKLQRTFVRASDAAATKAKGLKVSRTTTETQEDLSSEENNEPSASWAKIMFVEGTHEIPSSASYHEPPEPTGNNQYEMEINEIPSSASYHKPPESTANNQYEIKTHEIPSSKSTRQQPKETAENPFANIIIYEDKNMKNNYYLVTLQETLRLNGLSDENLFNVAKLPDSDNTYKCDVIWKGNVVCSVISEGTERAAKCLGAKKLLKIMQNHCNTIEPFVSATTIEKSVIGGSTKAPMDTPVAKENKCSKMLRMMGCTGGGLGKDGQGIADPVRYPQETMDLVSSLSAELPEVQSYREKKKAKLQRTFFRASDAAETRAQGLTVGLTTEMEDDPSAERNNEPLNLTASGPFANIVIMKDKYNNDSCLRTVESTFNTIGYSHKNLFHVTQVSRNNFTCDVTWQGNVVCSVNCARSGRAAKCLAATELLKLMQNHCYTIELLKPIVSTTTIEKSVTGGSTKAPMDTPVAEENKGSKMLRMMGWTGGGLGKDGQGIADPVRAVGTINRSGLGLQKLTVQQCNHKIRKYLDKFMADESASDLEFAADFTKEERAEIHRYVQRFRYLKTKSYGKDDERRLVVSKREQPHDMVSRLIQAGGSTEKHNLIWPLLSPRPVE